MATKKESVTPVSELELEVHKALQEIRQAQEDKLLQRAQQIANGRIKGRKRAEKYASAEFWRPIAKRVGAVLIRDVWADCPAPVNLGIVQIPDMWTADESGFSFKGTFVCSPCVGLGRGKWAVQKRNGSWEIVEPSVPRGDKNAAEMITRQLVAAGVRVSSASVTWEGQNIGSPEGLRDENIETATCARLAVWVLAGVGMDGGIGKSPVITLTEFAGRDVLDDMGMESKLALGRFSPAIEPASAKG